MSVQFGRWNVEGSPIDPDYIEKVIAALCAYGPDSRGSRIDTNISILYCAFHTTKESRREVQPHTCSSGAVITWDGRLDNRTDLIREIRDPLTVESTDLAIVASAYEKWGTNSFAKLIGDWALSIWNPLENALILAKDPIGTRHLYYTFDTQQVTWSTLYGPLVWLPGKTFELNEEYIAGWLSMFPAPHLTPYVGIYSVPPSTCVIVRSGKLTVKNYWDFNPKSKIRYRSDAEYEEHFRAAFTQAVQRRLRSDKPVLAELSGGRDSSSIVCIADDIFSRGVAETSRLDTISYFDDDEPSWNERPYFTKVEEKRGRTGWHVDLSSRSLTQRPDTIPESDRNRFYPTPGCDGRTSPELRQCLSSQGNRVVLSGIGGDEIMGGVPTPEPELANLLARARFCRLGHELKAWSLQKRKPWFHLFWNTSSGFLPPALVGVPQNMRPLPWLQPAFVRRHWSALTGYPYRTRLLGPLPSFQENVNTLEALRRQLTVAPLPFEPPYEKRYPYLDRCLLEFIFAIPREQIVRPTQRRSLLRRALVGIVPEEILNRKGKAFVARAPMIAISSHWSHFSQITQNMLSASLGIVDCEGFSESLRKVKRGEEVRMISLRRTLHLERWLRDLHGSGILSIDTHMKPALTWATST